MVQPPSGQRSDAKRTEILRRAAEVFRRKGFHGAGMRDIAASLEMAPGALYYYFESKEDLLHACQTIALRRLLRSAGDIAGMDAPADEKLRLLVRAHLGHILHELGGSFAHIEFHTLPEARLQDVLARRDEYEGIIRRVLAEGMQAGTFRAVDVRLTAFSLLGALNWTVVWWKPDGEHDLASVADHVSEIFLKGLMA